MQIISKLFPAVVLMAVAGDGVTQVRSRVYDQDDMLHRKTELLAEAWLGKANWVMSYAEAKAKAKQSGKMIFAYFTRSYAP